MKEYLTEIEKDKVIAFTEDEVMREAVKKVLMEGILAVGVFKEGVPFDERNWAYNLGGLNDFSLPNDRLGELLKATTKGIAFVEDGFKRLEGFKREEPRKPEGNPAE